MKLPKYIMYALTEIKHYLHNNYMIMHYWNNTVNNTVNKIVFNL